MTMTSVLLSLPVKDPTWIFLIVLVIILFAPLLLNKLRIPHIIGMILAGVLIGEHGLNILERDSSFELFGQVGLYYIMFLAGLEMDMEDFRKNKVKGLVFGLLTFAIPMALGVWSSMTFLGFGALTSVLQVRPVAAAECHHLYRGDSRYCHSCSCGARSYKRFVQRLGHTCLLAHAESESDTYLPCHHLRVPENRTFLLPEV